MKKEGKKKVVFVVFIFLFLILSVSFVSAFSLFDWIKDVFSDKEIKLSPLPETLQLIPQNENVLCIYNSNSLSRFKDSKSFNFCCKDFITLFCNDCNVAFLVLLIFLEVFSFFPSVC